MIRAFVLACAVALAAGCGSGNAAPAKTVTVTPTPAISWDDNCKVACQQVATGAYLNARMAAKLSTIRELADAALREEQTGATTLVKAWCAKNYHGQ